MNHLTKNNHNNLINDIIAAENRAAEIGFEWPNVEMIIENAISECEEIKEAISSVEGDLRIQEEIGDLLHTAISLTKFLNYDVSEILSNTSQKFNNRIDALKSIMHKNNLSTLKGQSIEAMMKMWKEAKRKASRNS